MRVVEGTVPARAQDGLTPQQKEQGVFMACVCHPTMPITVVRESERMVDEATLVGRFWFAKHIAEIVLELPAAVDMSTYHAGQFVHVYKSPEVSRCYSLAAVDAQTHRLHLHVRVYSEGQLSYWLAHEAIEGGRLCVSRPLGSCYYTGDNPEQPLLLIGTGTGLAPLYGIICDALKAGHQAPITLYHGSRDSSGLYAVRELQLLSQRYPQFTMVHAVSGPDKDMPSFAQRGRASDIALRNHPVLDGWRVYLCGHPEMVRATKRQAFLNGASMKAIFADAFVGHVD